MLYNYLCLCNILPMLCIFRKNASIQFFSDGHQFLDNNSEWYQKITVELPKNVIERKLSIMQLLVSATKTRIAYVNKI